MVLAPVVNYNMAAKIPFCAEAGQYSQKEKTSGEHLETLSKRLGNEFGLKRLATHSLKNIQ
jgi:hypothetical protein